MAERKTTTCAHGAEGFIVTLTEDNYPSCLIGHDADSMTAETISLVRFIREAVAGIFDRIIRDEWRGGCDAEGVREGFEMVCDLLVDRLEVVAGNSPMPLLRDMEAHHD